MIAVKHFSDVPASAWRWPDFTPEEMACHGDGSLTIDEAFMDRLQALRDACGFKLPISSGYRSPAYNDTVADTGTGGPHTTGRAADIRISGPNAFHLLRIAFQLGFTGVGLSQKGDYAKRFVHLDDIQNVATLPRPALWTY